MSAFASWAPPRREAKATAGDKPRGQLPPWALGEPLYDHEVKEIYLRVFGGPLPRHYSNKKSLQTTLIAYMGELAFDFEVNRLRGHALEQAA